MDASRDTTPMHVLPGVGRVATDGTVIRRERMIERPGRARAWSICYYPPASRTAFGTKPPDASGGHVRMLASTPYVTNDHDREEFPNELE